MDDSGGPPKRARSDDTDCSTGESKGISSSCKESFVQCHAIRLC